MCEELDKQTHPRGELVLFTQKNNLHENIINFKCYGNLCSKLAAKDYFVERLHILQKTTLKGNIKFSTDDYTTHIKATFPNIV